jgi:heme A synthase
MTSLRRYAYAAFGVACLHLVFGAIVRISGSGMGCGDHWPRCYGRWFPPLSRPDLIIEVSHRYLASILLVSLIALCVAAWRRRAEPGVGGRGGVLRAAALAVTLGFSAALLGAMTVKLGNAPLATLAHWTVAMSLVATVVAAVIRAGGLGGAQARLGGGTARARRGAFAGATMALLTVVMGGLTAKYPGAAVACRDFPLCGANPDVLPAAVHVQLTHRVLAVVVVLHLFGLMIGFRRRREPGVVRRASVIAVSLGVLQLLVAGAMIGLRLPPVLRSLHEATGVSIWIAAFALAYLARLANAERTPQPEIAPTQVPQPEIAPPRTPTPGIDPPAPPIEEPPAPARPEIDEPPRAPGPDIPPPSDVPPPPGGVPPVKMTMDHSVAVIVARGSDV